jgi:hypothetical protein
MLFGYDIGVISGAILFIRKGILAFPGPGGNRRQFGLAGIARSARWPEESWPTALDAGDC